MSAISASRGRFSFSLRSFLLVLIIGVVVASHMLTSYRLREATRTISQLRRELGELDVQDRAQLHALALDTGDPNIWRWRMFLPRGVRYSWNIAAKQIPQQGRAKPGVTGFANVPAGETELLVTARLTQSNADTWRLSVDSRSPGDGQGVGGASLAISDADLLWMRTIPSSERVQLGAHGTVDQHPSQPIELLRVRACAPDPNGGFSPSSLPQPGFMIWLEKY
jgi:hypothetical protein